MADFNVRSDSVDVEDIMRRIRARIREKRGTDYTEEQIKELATVKLEKFLDPKVVRSNLLEYYRGSRPPVIQLPELSLPDVPLGPVQPLAPPPAFALPPKIERTTGYVFDNETIYISSRGLSGRIIAGLRQLLNPILKLFFNPGPIIHALNVQAQLNERYAHYLTVYHATLQDHTKSLNDHARAISGIAPHLELTRAKLMERDATRGDIDLLNYEMLHNLVLEMTRVGIESKNLKMRVESLATRLDFDERRARALEGAVQYRPEQPKAAAAEAEATAASPSAETARSRRRRRRRRRGGGAGSAEAQASEALSAGAAREAEDEEPEDEEVDRERPGAAAQDIYTEQAEPVDPDAARNERLEDAFPLARTAATPEATETAPAADVVQNEPRIEFGEEAKGPQLATPSADQGTGQGDSGVDTTPQRDAPDEGKHDQ